MKHIGERGLAPLAFVTVATLAANSAAMSPQALPVPTRPIALVNDMTGGGGGGGFRGGGGGGFGGGIATGIAVGALLGAVASQPPNSPYQPSYPPQPNYPSPPQYGVPLPPPASPPQYAPPSPAPPTYAAAPAEPPADDTPKSDADPPRRTTPPSPSVPAVQQTMVTSAGATLDTTCAATPPPPPPRLSDKDQAFVDEVRRLMNDPAYAKKKNDEMQAVINIGIKKSLREAEAQSQAEQDQLAAKDRKEARKKQAEKTFDDLMNAIK